MVEVCIVETDIGHILSFGVVHVLNCVEEGLQDISVQVFLPAAGLGFREGLGVVLRDGVASELVGTPPHLAASVVNHAPGSYYQEIVVVLLHCVVASVYSVQEPLIVQQGLVKREERIKTRY